MRALQLTDGRFRMQEEVHLLSLGQCLCWSLLGDHLMVRRHLQCLFLHVDPDHDDGIVSMRRNFHNLLETRMDEVQNQEMILHQEVFKGVRESHARAGRGMSNQDSTTIPSVVVLLHLHLHLLCQTALTSLHEISRSLYLRLQSDFRSSDLRLNLLL